MNVNRVLNNGFLVLDVSSGVLSFDENMQPDKDGSLQIPLEYVASLNPIYSSDFGEDVLDWARNNNLKEVKSFYGITLDSPLSPEGWQKSPLSKMDPRGVFFKNLTADFFLENLWVCGRLGGDPCFLYAEEKEIALNTASNLRNVRFEFAVPFKLFSDYWMQIQSD